jgi:hypothetical protein
MNKDFENPIDADKIAENPGFLPYSHTISGPVIKPLDQGRAKGNAVKAMLEQTDMQLNQIYKQIELLAQQARAIQERKVISSLIYTIEIKFKPLIGVEYYLYQRKDDSYVLSMVGFEDWGNSFPFKTYTAKVKLLADSTWDLIEIKLPIEELLTSLAK